jgi:hypothetical protein
MPSPNAIVQELIKHEQPILNECYETNTMMMMIR